MSDLSQVLPVSEARKNLYSIVDEAITKLRRFVVTRREGGSITVLSTDEVESLEETMEIMSSKTLVKEIKQGLADIKNGRTKSLKDVEKRFKLYEN